MSLPMAMKPQQTALSHQLALALAPVIEEYLKEPKQALSDLAGRVENIEQKLEHEGLSRSQSRSMQKAAAKKVYDLVKTLPDVTARQHFANIYGSLKDKYNVGSYQDIPRDKFLQAMQLIASYDGSGRNWWMD